jgi:hypothetical protein
VPVPLVGLDSDNGSEFINSVLYYDCWREGITFTRGRVYALARLHVNFFQPVEKLVTNQRSDARVHRVFDRAQMPYQRLCATGVAQPRSASGARRTV